MNIIIFTDENVRRIWGEILERFSEDKLVVNLGFDDFDVLRKEGVLANITTGDAIEYLVKPFSDMVAGKYQVFLEEVRAFVNSTDELDNYEIPRLKNLDFQIQLMESQLNDLKAARKKRINRDLNLLGKKAEAVYTKETGQAELMELFGFKDTPGFIGAIRCGDVETAKKWLQHIVDHKERFPQYHSTWNIWLRDRMLELQNR